MSQDEPRLRYLAFCLAVLAGFVDASGFLQLGGNFVSFMSGNSTHMAVSAASFSGAAVTSALVISAFVIGVMFGGLLALLVGEKRKPAVLAGVSLILFAAASLHLFALDRAAVMAIAVAMGCANTTFQADDGEYNVGVTYMTGNLVKFGLGLVGTLSGRDVAWLPFLLLWLGLIGGATAGAYAYRTVGLHSLWMAAAAVAVLATLARDFASPRRPE